MQHSESLTHLATALAAAQAEIENATKNAQNPHFRNSYADLAEIINTVRPVLAKHGLALVQMPGFADGIVTVETVLLHTSGEWMSNVAGAPIPKADPQGVGSATTYLRRYSAAAWCCIAQEDDDGEAARPRGESPSEERVSVPSDRSVAAVNANTREPWNRLMPFGDTKGTPLGEHSPAALRKTVKWCRDKDAEKWAALIADCEATIARLEAH